MKNFKVMPPIGNIVIPKEVMSEKELREFIKGFAQEEETEDVWLEKAEKDPIMDLVDWLNQIGYQVIEVK